MATTLTPRGKQILGPGLVLDYGDYSTDGSTTATISFTGGYVIALQFLDANQNPLNAGTSATVATSARSTANGVTSYTLTPGGSAVTGGTYFALHGGL